MENASDLKLELRTTEILTEVGFAAHLNGYHYSREAIILSVKDNEAVGSITKLIYPDIAKTHSSTVNRVERAIRTAIEYAWKFGKRENHLRYFGNSKKARPTNSEFIAMVADNLRLKYKCCTV